VTIPHDACTMAELTGPVPTGIMVLRAWVEGDPPSKLRARLTTTAGMNDSERSMTVADSVDDVCVAVRTWLSEFVEEAGHRAVTER
jgi:hypothetical protein